MVDVEKVKYDIERCTSLVPGSCQDCSHFAQREHFPVCMDELLKDALALLEEREPRVMTFDEVKEHYSLPPVFVDDLEMQEDYLLDIKPLYFDFPNPTPWDVHWRGANQVVTYLECWEEKYGKTWRCWTAKPTDKQREAVKWDG